MDQNNPPQGVSPPLTSPSLVGSLDMGPTTARASRNRSLVNLLKMGHCAPTVMQTLLEVSHSEAQWLVKLTAGLPGGIGNTRFECGGITAPLVLLGLRTGLGPMHQGLPDIFYQGHDLWQRFVGCNHASMCSQILGKDRLPIRYIGVIRSAPELYAQTLASEIKQAISGEQEEAYRHLYAPMTARNFHCAHAVFEQLVDTIPVNQQLLDASAGFMGGTLFKGQTCSAFAAGVMALGLKLAEIENSPLRVMRMIGLMAVGGDAFADHINKFNRIMNLGNKLSQWFTDEFGSTQCQAITGCNFACMAGVNKYIESDGVTRCEFMAQRIAGKVREMMGDSPPLGDQA